MDEESPSEKILVLLSLIKETNLVYSLFPKDFREKANKKIEELTKDSQYGKAIIEICDSFIEMFLLLFNPALFSYDNS